MCDCRDSLACERPHRRAPGPTISFKHSIIMADHNLPLHIVQLKLDEAMRHAADPFAIKFRDRCGDARMKEVFTAPRYIVNRPHDPRTKEKDVPHWPQEMIEAVTAAFHRKLEEMFAKDGPGSTWPFNDPDVSLEYEKHKYWHTKQEWEHIIKWSLSRMFTHDPDTLMTQLTLGCWTNCAANHGPTELHPRITVGPYNPRMGKYLLFLWTTPEVRYQIMSFVNDSAMHCSHQCHNSICVNPNHLVFEPNPMNGHRSRKCQRIWKKVLNDPESTAYQSCPVEHQPKCLFVDIQTGILLPKYNFRAPTAVMDAAGRHQGYKLFTYEEPDPDADSLTEMLHNWELLAEDPEVDSSWEQGQVAEFRRQEWKDAQDAYFDA